MSVKPCSSNSEHSHSADSTSASAVARPYLASRRLSSEPALTPIRIGTPAAEAACAISATLSSNALMFPGFTLTAAQPASIAAKTYLGWKWMSAITGICDLRAMSGRASASSWEGTATRTIWQPVAVSSAICWSVAFTSAVSVVVIDCTDTGAPPPTGTACLPLPTMICRETRRCASGRAATSGMPRLTVMVIALLKLERIEDVRGDQQRAETDEHEKEADAERYQLLHVDGPRIGPAEQPGEGGPGPFEDHDGELSAVERQERQQVEQADEYVHRRDHQQDERDLRRPTHPAGADHLTSSLADPDHAGDAAAVLGPIRREQLGDLAWQL